MSRSRATYSSASTSDRSGVGDRGRRGSRVCARASRFGAGIFVCSNSPAIAEACAHSGVDWICIDAQHGAVSNSTLHDLLAATSAAPARRIVRVGGPDDAYGMQQALE